MMLYFGSTATQKTRASTSRSRWSTDVILSENLSFASFHLLYFIVFGQERGLSTLDATNMIYSEGKLHFRSISLLQGSTPVQSALHDVQGLSLGHADEEENLMEKPRLQLAWIGCLQRHQSHRPAASRCRYQEILLYKYSRIRKKGLYATESSSSDLQISTALPNISSSSNLAQCLPLVFRPRLTVKHAGSANFANARS